MRILVTGAAGYIGGKLVESLCKKAWVEKVVGTDIREPAQGSSGYGFFKQDIREPLEEILDSENVDTVIHTAYVLPPLHDDNLMEDINKGGTRNVLRASVRAGVRQILYTSSTTAYGFHPDNDFPLTEESPLRGNDDFTYARNKREIENIIRSFSTEYPHITLSVVRPCFVVGPGFDNPLARHLKKRIVLLPGHTKPFQFVHEDDLINVMVLLLKNRLGGIYNVAGEGTVTFPEMVNMLGNTPLPLPLRILSPLNSLAWQLRLSAMTEFPSPVMNMMIHPWVATSEKLIRDTGYAFMYDSCEAFKDFVRHVRSHRQS
ncbi:epimerase [Desulfonema ishimotonii]|uniref:Epimerase n=1 Tax=Desulfonema ishimotonii TaxID=45657 RepID=A0A401FY24_9BACT|nr:NAD-dependent epimerase/dehydratase family protein [Desulfonema ishimotonii]GBC61860.1 epimerase [Desulfonema ishimotonii]